MLRLFLFPVAMTVFNAQLWVADSRNLTVATTAGAVVARWPVDRTFQPTDLFPYGQALYVVEEGAGRSRVRALNANGQLIGGWWIAGMNVRAMTAIGLELYVTTLRDHRGYIMVYDLEGRAKRRLDTLERPSGIATDGTNLYVATWQDTPQGRRFWVLVQSPIDGRVLRNWAIPGAASGLARYGDELYVADPGNQHVWVYGLDGRYRRGLSNHRLYMPVDTVVYGSGLYVLDHGHMDEKIAEIDYYRNPFPRQPFVYPPQGVIPVYRQAGHWIAVFGANGGLRGHIGKAENTP